MLRIHQATRQPFLRSISASPSSLSTLLLTSLLLIGACDKRGLPSEERDPGATGTATDHELTAAQSSSFLEWQGQWKARKILWKSSGSDEESRPTSRQMEMMMEVRMEVNDNRAFLTSRPELNYPPTILLQRVRTIPCCVNEDDHWSITFPFDWINGGTSVCVPQAFVNWFRSKCPVFVIDAAGINGGKEERFYLISIDGNRLILDVDRSRAAALEMERMK